MADAALTPTTERRRRLRRSGLLLAATVTAVAVASGPAEAAAPAVAAPSSPAEAAAPSPVIAGYAGMLDDLVVNGLQPGVAPGISIDRRAGSSLGVARDIRSGVLPADLYGSADSNANQILTGEAKGNKVRWYGAFARAEMVFAYSQSPTLPRRALFDAAANGSIPWYQAIEKNPLFPDLKILRSNPNNDPSGYYALFVMQLAEQFHHKPGLKQDVLGADLNPTQVGPPVNPTLLSSGAIDGIFLYKSFAEAFGLKYLSLPPEINLSDPAHANFYARASYFNTTDNTTYRGGVIRPSFAPVEGAANSATAEKVLHYLFANRADLTAQRHFLPSELYAGGDPASIPVDLRPYFHLRETELTVAVPDGCSPEQLDVAGGGATVVSAKRLPGAFCRIKVHAQAGPTGDQALIVKRDINLRGRTMTLVIRTLPGVVHLTDAIPVKPDFLR